MSTPAPDGVPRHPVNDGLQPPSKRKREEGGPQLTSTPPSIVVPLPQEVQEARNQMMRVEAFQAIELAFSSIPGLEAAVKSGLDKVNKMYQDFFAAQRSLANAKLKLQSGTPSKSLIPTFRLALPNGYEIPEATVNQHKTEFALKLQELIVARREQHVKDLQAKLGNTAPLLDEALKAYLAEGGSARPEMMRKVSGPYVTIWWEHQMLLIKDKHETAAKKARALAEKQALKAAQVAMDLDEAPAEQLVGTVVQVELSKHLSQVMKKLEALRVENEAMKKEVAEFKQSQEARVRNRGRGRSRGRGAHHPRTDNESPEAKGRDAGGRGRGKGQGGGRGDAQKRGGGRRRHY